RGMRKRRPLRAQPFGDVKAHARTPLSAVPVPPVAFHLAERRGHLVRRRLDFLEPDDIRLLAFNPFLHLRVPRANAIHVPCSDFHPEIDSIRPAVLHLVASGFSRKIDALRPHFRLKAEATKFWE